VVVYDRHIRILRQVAHETQRQLGDHQAAPPVGDGSGTGRGVHLERAVTLTRARVADAEHRRR
jgi:hypothetical protein